MKYQEEKGAQAYVDLRALDILDALPFYAMIIDEEHRILLANKVVKDSLGKDPHNIIGDYCPKAIHNSDSPVSDCPLEEAVETGGESVVREIYDPQSQRWFNSGIYLIKRQTGEGKQVFFHTVFDITEEKKMKEQLKESFQRLQKTLQGTIDTLASAVELRDPYTAGHQKRATQLARAIAREIGLPEEKTQTLAFAASIHDIGKMHVPAEILNRPGPLNDIEYKMVQAHPRMGYEILKNADFPWPTAEIILQTHERMDGSGYPQGISGDEILLEARILAVAEVVEAMSSHRPYRPALGIDKALEEIQHNKGRLYDSRVVDICVELFRKKGFKFEQE